MNCNYVYKYICENLDANMNSARCRAIRKHLESCNNCAAYLDSLKKTILLYKREAVPRVPPSAHRRLFKALDSNIWASSGRKRRSRSLRTAPGRQH